LVEFAHPEQHSRGKFCWFEAIMWCRHSKYSWPMLCKCLRVFWVTVHSMFKTNCPILKGENDAKKSSKRFWQSCNFLKFRFVVVNFSKSVQLGVKLIIYFCQSNRAIHLSFGVKVWECIWMSSRATPWLKERLLEALSSRLFTSKWSNCLRHANLNYAKHKLTITLHVISINLLSLVQYVSLKMLGTFWRSTHSIIG
jgi:hypothetical protein